MLLTPSRWRLVMRKSEEATLVRFWGDAIELHQHDADRMREELLPLAERGRQHLILDLGNVVFLSSVVIEVLLGLHRCLKVRGGRLTVCNLIPPINEVFAILRLNAVFEVRADWQSEQDSY